RNAKRAGFDGVEIHGANGYLFDQFMNSTLNTRRDGYGGQTPQTRTRLLLEVVDAATSVLGAENVGVRGSPYGTYGSMPDDPRVQETFLYLSAELSRRGAAYLHVIHQLQPSGTPADSEFNEPRLSEDFVREIRHTFDGALMLVGGFTKSSAQAALD